MRVALSLLRGGATKLEGNGAATRRSVQCLEEDGWWLQNIKVIRSITVVITDMEHNMEHETWKIGGELVVLQHPPVLVYGYEQTWRHKSKAS